MSRPLQIAVIGPADADADLLAAAEEVGSRLAEAGARVVCGGLGGAMEAAARGASATGGEVIGILPTSELADANPHVTHPVATGMGQARNVVVAASADAVIAIGGSWGTLTEMAHARRLGRPVVALGGWTVAGAGAEGPVPAADPAAAATAALVAARDAGNDV